MPSFSMQECRKLAELAEADCMADFFRAAPPAFAEAQSLYLEQTNSYTATATKNSHDFGMYNRVFALGVGQPTTEKEVDYVVDLYRQAHVSFLVRLSPDAQPPELPRWLENRGLTFLQESNSARFYLRPTKLISHPHSFHICTVGIAEATDFARIACLDHHHELQTWLLATIGRDGWHHYIALWGNTPVGSGVLYTQGEIGWLGWAVTLPAYRRKGVQQALLVHRINEAFRMGCSLVSAETRGETADFPNPSYHNLLHMGFHLAYFRQHYYFEPTHLLEH